MSDFDPYHQWLGIPLQEQPAHHYRLLGITDFESDRDVISAAAERQTIYLRTLQAGEHAVLVAELLNEVSRARVTLLNADQKAGYDAELREQQIPEPEAEPTPVPIQVVQTPPPTPVVVRGTVTKEFPVSIVQPAKRPRRTRQKQTWKRRVVIGVSVVSVISVFVLVMSMMSSGDAEPGVQNIPPVLTSPAVALFDMAQAKAHQKSWADHLGVTVETANSIGMEFAVIPAGEFTMGSNTFEDIEKPTHKVTLTQPFQLGMYEVTQEQYAKVVGTNPSKNKGSANPVEQVSWLDAVAFCKLLSDLPEEKASRYVYRLPTEAEWEHACRAGTTSDYSFGNGDSELGDYAWNSKNSGGTSHPVGGKQPNGFGLYDMHGNVWEWCQDWKGDYLSSSVINPTGPVTGGSRRNRGGGWGDGSNRCRSAYRGGNTPDYRRSHLGFRLVRELD
jgi:formylglycine-generating enzyme required for sulfatase activity